MALIWPAKLMRDPDIFVTDFSEYTTGAKPADWTQRWTTTDVPLVQSVAGSLSGKSLRWSKTSASRQALSWDRIAAVADCEILYRIRAIEAYADSEPFARSVLRGGGAAASEQGYLGNTIGRNIGTLYALSGQKYVAGASTTIIAVANGGSPNYAVNGWIWSRTRLIGTSLGLKVWEDGQAEPGAFTSVTDSSISTAGWVGFGIGSNNPDVEIDFFSVALNSKTAPMVRR
mgnify:CR=1 FL=1|jgi:hypothetical protein